MASKKKPSFDQETAFKSIIGTNHENSGQVYQEQNEAIITGHGTEKESRGKGRPKTEGETKKRVTLALYPSIYSDLQKIAYVKRQSISEIVSELVISYISENTDELEEYERIKKK